MKNFAKLCVLPAILMLMYCSPSKEQIPSSSNLPIETMLKSRDFQFNAQSMTTHRGKREFLTPGYDLILSGDSLISALPFKGRSTQAPMNPDEAGYFFSTTDFNYNFNKKSDNSWELKMELFDQRFTRSIYLNVFENGKAELDIYSNFRDPIHFSGYFVKKENE